MLTEDRFQMILDILKEKKSVTVTDLTKQLDTSESTIRRDLLALDKKALLHRVHGGATTIVSTHYEREEAVSQKTSKNVHEKQEIAKYCASLIEEEDFVYIDAGTTTELMIDYLTIKQATYVTNAVTHALKLMKKGFHVCLIGGELKEVTEAIVGSVAIENLEKYNFTKGFFGANGIDLKTGITTPDVNEAMIKKVAKNHCLQSYILADHSKFAKITAITFCQMTDTIIITDKIEDKNYKKLKNIKEVL